MGHRSVCQTHREVCPSDSLQGSIGEYNHSPRNCQNFYSTHFLFQLSCHLHSYLIHSMEKSCPRNLAWMRACLRQIYRHYCLDWKLESCRTSATPQIACPGWPSRALSSPGYRPSGQWMHSFRVRRRVSQCCWSITGHAEPFLARIILG